MNAHKVVKILYSISLFLLCIAGASSSWQPYVVGGCAAVACLYGVSCLKVVTTGNECLVERFGKYHRRLEPGWHFVKRPIESVSYSVTLREQVLDVPPQPCYTADNAPLSADAVVYLRVVSPEQARYQVRDLPFAIKNLCLTQLREQIGKLTMDECLASRDVVNGALLKEMNPICSGWGVEIVRVEIQSLEPSGDIKHAMELQMSAERKKRAAILESEGERSAQENKAEAKAYALLADTKAQTESIKEYAKAEAMRKRLEGEAWKDAIREVAQAIGEANGESGPSPKTADATLQLLLVNRYMGAQEKIATSENTKLLMFPTKDSIPLTHSGLHQWMR